MDILTLVTTTIPEIAPYVAWTVALASVVVAAVPQPQHQPWPRVWAVLRVLALNVGRARQ